MGQSFKNEANSSGSYNEGTDAEDLVAGSVLGTDIRLCMQPEVSACNQK
jgi:hypothetical protein